jgi:hypothetical protein
VTKPVVFIGSAVMAGLVGLALLLRPHETAREELVKPERIPAAMARVIATKMARHDLQMRTLVSRVVLLDDDGIARAAGEIFDEPALARPLAGDELNGLLPERFYVLQDEMRKQTRQLVVASGRHDRAAVANEFAALMKTCIACHDVYLHGADPSGLRAEGAR